MSLRVVPAQPDDVAAIVSLINTAYDVAELGDSGTAFKTTVRLLPQDVPGFARDVASGAVLAARDGADGAGAILGVIHTTVSDGHGHFGPLAVAVSAQGRGVARALVAAAEAAASAAGAADMRIEVVECRTDVLPVYERAGYVAYGTGDFPAPERCSRPVRFILMAKKLQQ